MHVSSWIAACVLMVQFVCPHAIMRVPSCHHAYVLMKICMCPHASNRYLPMTQGKTHDTFGLPDPPGWDIETSDDVVVVNSRATPATESTFYCMCVNY